MNKHQYDKTWVEPKIIWSIYEYSETVVAIRLLIILFGHANYELQLGERSCFYSMNIGCISFSEFIGDKNQNSSVLYFPFDELGETMQFSFQKLRMYT